jgi:hypothetical protein
METAETLDTIKERSKRRKMIKKKSNGSDGR